MENRPLPVGTVLKTRYRVTRLVAGGGMAWVYEVAEERPDGSRQTWAMKELRADSDDSHTLEEGRQLFRQEAEILVDLSHPNLPQVVAFFEEAGRSYLVMEFIYGESLEKRLERASAPLLEGEVLDWAIQVCEVLSYLHSRPTPVIFRDMKPSNIMVTPNGQIKLIDFGIARTYKAGKSKDTMTMGSENYAAPEQWGKAQTDPRADVYGLGATMYHLLTNVPPLPAFVPTPRVPIQQYNPAVTDATVSVVEKALAKDRNLRFDSAEAMRQALLQCLSKRDRRRIELRAQQPAATSPATTGAGHVQVSAMPTPARAQEPRATAVSPRQPVMRVESDAYSRVCPRCSTSNRAEARFCRGCGYSFVPAPPPVLAVVRPPGARWEYPLQDADVLLGRQGGEQPVDLDLGFYDPNGYVSRNHARITADNRRYHLTDLNSANGTYVNGERLAPHAPRLLRHGDKIRVGRVVLHFRIR